MILLANSYHDQKLKEKEINIKTKYIVGKQILERNTDHTVNDDITQGICYEKQYYYRKQLIHTEKFFDSRIEYNFLTKNLENQLYTCPNCGMQALLKNLDDGCPYCRTHYNIDYQDKNLGSKYHYDLVLQSNTYKFITFFFDSIISMFLSYWFLKITSRTWNSYDILKVFIYGSILTCILYYLFYLLDAYVILEPIRIYKQKQNQKQIKFWNETGYDKRTFFNNVNYELQKYYSQQDDVIDYDILDYLELISRGKNMVEVKINIRIISFRNHKLHSKLKKHRYLFKRYERPTLKLKDGVNVISCHNCGASIDVNQGKCNYCQSEIRYFQEWILEKVLN